MKYSTGILVTKFTKVAAVLLLCTVSAACTGKKGSGGDSAAIPKSVKLGPVTLTLPLSNPLLSNLNSVTFGGACDVGATVAISSGVLPADVLTPAGNLAQTCDTGTYSFTIGKSVDGTFTLNVLQGNGPGTTSNPVVFTWQRNTVAPTQPIILNPPQSPMETSNDITISGICPTGSTVVLSGDDNQSTPCTSGSFAFPVSKSFGTHNFTVGATDAFGNASATVPQQWIKSAEIPPTPTIAAPAANPIYTNTSSLLIAGTCNSGDTVNLSGSDSQSVACASSNYSFTVSKSADGTYNFNVSSSNAQGGISPSVSQQWIRDTVAPAVPTILSPASNPFYSSTDLTLAGGCESGSTIALSGDSTQNVVCGSTGFSFNVVKADGTYNFSLKATDIAGNESAAVTLSWNKNGAAPAVPTIASPSMNPVYTNGSTLAVSGTCVTGNNVDLTGDDTQNVSCVGNAYSFAINKSVDGTYNFGITQTSPNGITSGPAGFQWVRDTVAPTVPTIASPSQSPFSSSSNLILAGACETGSSIALSGDSTQSVACVGGAYSFNISKSTDGTYNFSVVAGDLAGNTSAAATQQWILDTSMPNAPTIATPAANPVYTNGNSIVIAGACEDQSVVSLSGDATQNVTCASNAYSFTVNKTADGNYNFNVAQKDEAGNNSSAASVQWIRDTVAPSALTVVSPATNPFDSNGNAVTISGACESGAHVSLSGDSSQGATCSASAYSLTVSKTIDGTYNFSLKQTDLAGNDSAASDVQWVRYTVAPNVPVLAQPAGGVILSNGNSIVVSGSCVNGNTITLNGDDSQSMVCTGGNFSFTVAESADGTYNYSITQTDEFGNTSSSTVAQWQRDTVAPASPIITVPAASPFYSNGNNLAISGTCASGATVNMTGASAQSAACVGSAFSFLVSKSVDGVYNFNVTQTDGAGNASSAVSTQWNRNTVAPAAPSIASPAASPVYTNGNSLTIAGTCVTGYKVDLDGADVQTATCASSAYSFVVSKSSDGSYSYTVAQTDLYGNESAAANVTWIRDTVSPAAPGLATPAENPFNSGDTTFTLSGSCETGATVALSGDSTGSQVCGSSIYSFVITKSVDGNYSFQVAQTDSAANVSPALNFAWTRDTSVPPTPVIASPSVNPFYSNGNSLTISGSCVAGDNVEMTGASAQQMVCTAGGTYSFSVSAASDGTYAYSIIDTDAADNSSAAANLQWIRDTAVPAAPTLVNPSTSPYYSSGNLAISGGCETGNTVNLTGASTQSMVCAANSYNFTVVQATDGTYNFNIRQTDKAGNISSPRALQWVRNSVSPPTPTITTPSANPYLSNQNTLTISGGCVTGDTVTLGGDVVASEVTSPANSLSRTCLSSSYSFTIAKSADGTYNLTVKDTNLSGIDSGNASLQWTRDMTAPTVSITAQPASTNLSADAAFSFTSNDAAATFRCQLDSGTLAACTSPLTYTAMVNGSHTFSVQAVDVAGNVSSAATYTWTQASYQTIALYHFNTSPGALVDSSNYPAGLQNTLVNTGTTSSASGKFSQGQLFTQASTNYMTAAHNATQDTSTSLMTVEAFVKFTTLPDSTNSQVIASKMGASGNYGWEFKVKRRSGTSYRLYFKASLNGTTTTEVQASSSCTLSTGTYYHFAMTWNKGTVRFFCNGTSKGSKTIGTAGSSVLFSSTAPLILGESPLSGTVPLNGTMDEFRLSNVQRWSGSFTAPTTAYTAD